MLTGALGFWWRSLGGAPPPREPLRGPAEADVAIVGAGYTGLWTAYYLKRAQPGLRVVVLERERAGFGASGRNGGWVSGFFAGSPVVYERAGGRAGLVALQRAMLGSVDEVGEVLAAHGLQADFVKSGQLTVALGEAQATRLAAWVQSARERGYGSHDLEHLSAPHVQERVRVVAHHLVRLPADLLPGAGGQRLGDDHRAVQGHERAAPPAQRRRVTLGRAHHPARPHAARGRDRLAPPDLAHGRRLVYRHPQPLDHSGEPG